MEKQKSEYYHLFHFIARDFMASEPYGMDLKVTLSIGRNNFLDVKMLFKEMGAKFIDPVPDTPTENPDAFRTYVVDRHYGKEIAEALNSIDAFGRCANLKSIMETWYNLDEA